MQHNKKQLLQEIEDLRRELNIIGIEKGLRDPKVYKKSKKLDKLINEYYRLKYN
jgi:hypothetical protein